MTFTASLLAVCGIPVAVFAALYAAVGITQARERLRRIQRETDRGEVT